jgi:peptidoglycan/LPS O-acetylase OafA/YrhL
VARGLATPFVPTYLANTHFPIYYLTPFRVDLLAMGGLMAWLTHHDPAWPKKHARQALVAMAASLAVFVACALRMPSFRTSANSLLFNTAGYTLVGLFLASLLLACLALPQNRIYRFLTMPVLLYLGKISYMMYLVHELALDLFPRFSLWARAGCALAATIAFAALSWELMKRRLVQHPRKQVPRPAI